MPRFIGDVHSKYGPYETIIKKYPDTIQVGDMGVGFKYTHERFEGDIWAPNPPHEKMVKTRARFIRGNHDNPHVCSRHSQWIADGTIEGDMMFVGGAWSIDHAHRKEGYTWWPEEELSHSDMMKIYDIYVRNKPRIMVTHDAPQCMLPYLLSHHMHFSTRTGQFLDRLFEEHKPQVWVHGHHHISFDQEILSTRFVCLAELEHKWID